VAIIAALFQAVGLSPDEAKILINDRRLTNNELEKLGANEEQHQEALLWIDRRDKLSPEKWEDYGREIGFTQSQIEGAKAFLQNDNLWQESQSLVKVFDTLEAMGSKEYVKYDPGIIRGLPYYTGIVFEAFDVRGSVRRAILGGGRYNNLMEAVGGDPMPAVGFAMGDVVISLILKELGLMPDDLAASPAPVLVTVFDADSQLEASALATELRQAGINVTLYPNVGKLGKQFKYADRTGARIAMVLGPDEITNGQVTIKNLVTREQTNIARETAPEFIKEILAGK
jgi:histidyl-tRNA synthetase